MTRINDVLKNEQLFLWNDLDRALRYANNGFWSMGCEEVIQRIYWIAREIGPNEWENIPVSLLVSGIYQAVLKLMGFDVPEIPDLTLRWPGHDYSTYLTCWQESIPNIEKLELDFFLEKPNAKV